MFSSVTERRQAAWKPDGLTLAPSEFGIKWKDVLYEWKCVERKVVEEVCLVPRRTINVALVNFFGVVDGQVSECVVLRFQFAHFIYCTSDSVRCLVIKR